MRVNKLVDEVREANLSYLILAKRMIGEDKAEACYRMGISEELADVISGLSTAQVLKLAASNMLMCRFRFDDRMIWDLVTDHASEHGMGNIHAAILMGAQPVEAL